MQVREAIVRAFLKIKAKDFIHLDHIYDEVKLIRPASTRESVRARLQEWSKRHGAMRLDIGKRQHYQGPPDLFTSLMSEGGRNGYWKLNNNKDVDEFCKNLGVNHIAPKSEPSTNAHDNSRTELESNSIKSSKKMPKWVEDEIIVLLAAYFSFKRGEIPNKNSQIIKDLRDEILKVTPYKEFKDNRLFRNLAGIYAKLMNFIYLDPEIKQTGLKNHSQLDLELFSKFFTKRGKLLEIYSELIPNGMFSANLKNCTFVYSGQLITKKCADHNVIRWLWIGQGKSYQEIDAKGSIYRERGVKKKGFNRRTSSIDPHLQYDIDNGWIKKVQPLK